MAYLLHATSTRSRAISGKAATHSWRADLLREKSSTSSSAVASVVLEKRISGQNKDIWSRASTSLCGKCQRKILCARFSRFWASGPFPKRGKTPRRVCGLLPKTLSCTAKTGRAVLPPLIIDEHGSLPEIATYAQASNDLSLDTDRDSAMTKCQPQS